MKCHGGLAPATGPSFRVGKVGDETADVSPFKAPNAPFPPGLAHPRSGQPGRCRGQVRRSRKRPTWSALGPAGPRLAGQLVGDGGLEGLRTQGRCPGRSGSTSAGHLRRCRAPSRGRGPGAAWAPWWWPAKSPGCKPSSAGDGYSKCCKTSGWSRSQTRSRLKTASKMNEFNK